MANRSTPNAGNVPGPGSRSIGPSNSSDSGSDLAGVQPHDGDEFDSNATAMDDSSDAQGTGERSTAGADPDVRIGSDIGLDRVVGPEDAGLGGGLDQAEEARLGITDEEIEELARTRAPKK